VLDHRFDHFGDTVEPEISVMSCSPSVSAARASLRSVLAGAVL
jgi:hypothetical protein